MSTKKNFPIIEPIYGITKLSMMCLYPEGTKISYNNDELYFSKNNFFQGISRWKNEGSREQLKYLYPCIVKTLQFLKQRTINIDYILKLVIHSVKELRKIYTNDSFLLLYLNKIIKVIENYQEHKQLTLSHSYYIIDYPDSININIHNQLWNINEINLINDTLKNMYMCKFNLIRVSEEISNKYVINGLEFLDLFLEYKKIQFNKLQNN